MFNSMVAVSRMHWDPEPSTAVHVVNGGDDGRPSMVGPAPGGYVLYSGTEVVRDTNWAWWAAPKNIGLIWLTIVPGWEVGC